MTTCSGIPPVERPISAQATPPKKKKTGISRLTDDDAVEVAAAPVTEARPTAPITPAATTDELEQAPPKPVPAPAALPPAAQPVDAANADPSALAAAAALQAEGLTLPDAKVLDVAATIARVYGRQGQAKPAPTDGPAPRQAAPTPEPTQSQVEEAGNRAAAAVFGGAGGAPGVIGESLLRSGAPMPPPSAPSNAAFGNLSRWRPA